MPHVPDEQFESLLRLAEAAREWRAECLRQSRAMQHMTPGCDVTCAMGPKELALFELVGGESRLWPVTVEVK